MRLRHAAVLSVSAAFLAACVWIMGGDAWAARREGRSEFAWTAAFGRLEDLKKKYPKVETNETAKRLAELTRGTVFDLTPVAGPLERARRTHVDCLQPRPGFPVWAGRIETSSSALLLQLTAPPVHS